MKIHVENDVPARPVRVIFEVGADRRPENWIRGKKGGGG